MVIIKGLENRVADRSLRVCARLCVQARRLLDESFKSILPLQNHLVSNLHYATPQPNKTLMGDVAWNSREIYSAKKARSTFVPPSPPPPPADPDDGC